MSLCANYYLLVISLLRVTQLALMKAQNFSITAPILWDGLCEERGREQITLDILGGTANVEW